MQFVASVVVVVIGLLLALVYDAAGDMRVFGWVLVVIGLLGLVARSWLAHQRRDGQRRDGQRRDG
jgi:hypothetical protein